MVRSETSSIVAIFFVGVFVLFYFGASIDRFGGSSVFRWPFVFFLPSGFVLLLKFFSSKVLCYRNWSCYESEELFLIDV